MKFKCDAPSAARRVVASIYSTEIYSYTRFCLDVLLLRFQFENIKWSLTLKFWRYGIFFQIFHLVSVLHNYFKRFRTVKSFKYQPKQELGKKLNNMNRYVRQQYNAPDNNFSSKHFDIKVTWKGAEQLTASTTLGKFIEEVFLWKNLRATDSLSAATRLLMESVYKSWKSLNFVLSLNGKRATHKLVYNNTHMFVDNT